MFKLNFRRKDFDQSLFHLKTSLMFENKLNLPQTDLVRINNTAGTILNISAILSIIKE